MSKVFPITPASIGVLSVVGIILIPIIFLMGLVAYSARNTRFEVNGEGLRIKGAIYGRFIPKESIIIEDSRILNLNVERELKPIMRTNGIGLPGYSEGWFKMANGEMCISINTYNEVMPIINHPKSKIIGLVLPKSCENHPSDRICSLSLSILHSFSCQR